eukprot:351562-Rhodomonas_salina.1
MTRTTRAPIPSPHSIATPPPFRATPTLGGGGFYPVLFFVVFRGGSLSRAFRQRCASGFNLKLGCRGWGRSLVTGRFNLKMLGIPAGATTQDPSRVARPGYKYGLTNRACIHRTSGFDRPPLFVLSKLRRSAQIHAKRVGQLELESVQKRGTVQCTYAMSMHTRAERCDTAMPHSQTKLTTPRRSSKAPLKPNKQKTSHTHTLAHHLSALLL